MDQATRNRLSQRGVQQLPSPEKLKMLRERLDKVQRPKNMSEQEFQDKLKWIRTDLETLDPSWPPSEELDWNKEMDVMLGELSEMKYHAATRLAFNQGILFQEPAKRKFKSMKSISKKIVTGLVVLLISYIAFKSFYSEYVHFDELAAYQRVSETGETTTLFFIPRNKHILLKEYKDQYEYGVYEIRGSNAVHYFGPLYRVSNSLFGFRFFFGAEEVWKIEMTLTRKDGNLSQSTFESEGDKLSDLLIISSGTVTIGNSAFQRINLSDSNREFVKKALNVLK